MGSEMCIRDSNIVTKQPTLSADMGKDFEALFLRIGTKQWISSAEIATILGKKYNNNTIALHMKSKGYASARKGNLRGWIAKVKS